MSVEMEPGVGRADRPAWRIHYGSAEIIVTSWYVEVDGLRVPIRELRAATRVLTYRYPLVKVAAVTGAVELGIALPFAAVGQSWAMLGVGVLSAFGMVAGIWGDSRRNPRHQEIHATVRGRRVVLFGTGDHREFGCVWRALVRAVENDRDRDLHLR